MKKLFTALWCLAILSGCAVHAGEDPETLSGVVVECDEDSAVIEIVESPEDAEEEWESGARMEVREGKDLILFDGDEPSDIGCLEKDDRVMITFSGRKTVMHRLDEEEILESESSPQN